MEAKYYVIKEKDTVKVLCSSQVIQGAKEVGPDYQPSPYGRDSKFYDGELRPLTEEALLKQGILEDHRGDWYDTQGQQRKILKIGAKPEEGWRRENPEPWEVFKDGKWVIDKEAKARKGREEELQALKRTIREREEILSSTDWYELRERDSQRLAELDGDPSLIKPVPEEVLRRRQAAREELSRLRPIKEQLDSQQTD